MKDSLKIILIVAIIVLQGCSTKLQHRDYSATVEFIYKENTGTIAVKSSVYAKNRENAIEDAQRNAFNVILFKGIPGTDLNVPLVENESEAKSKHGDYFKKLLDQGDYNKYMMSSAFNSESAKVKGGIWVSLDIKINYNSLRKDLEQNQIVRKFGF